MVGPVASVPNGSKYAGTFRLEEMSIVKIRPIGIAISGKKGIDSSEAGIENKSALMEGFL